MHRVWWRGLRHRCVPGKASNPSQYGGYATIGLYQKCVSEGREKIGRAAAAGTSVALACVLSGKARTEAGTGPLARGHPPPPL